MSAPHVRGPDVVYIHPAKQEVGFAYGRRPSGAAYEIMPVGVIGLLNMLREGGLSVRGLNYPVERLIDTRFDLAAWLRRTGRPRLVLIDLHWYEHSFGALDLARAVKEVFADVPLALGGLAVSGYAGEILRDHAVVDYVIRGDAEEPLRRLAGTLCGDAVSGLDNALAAIPNLAWRRDGTVTLNPLAYTASADDLERLDYAGLDWLEHAGHYRGFQYVGRGHRWAPADGPTKLGHWLCIGRGCVYDCSYCGGGKESHRALAGRCAVVARSPGRVAGEIEALIAGGVQQVSLSLDPAILGADYFTALSGELVRRRVRPGLYIEVFQLPSREFVRALAACADMAHTEVAITVLAGEKVRRRHGKRYTDAHLFRALAPLREHSVPLTVYFSLNLPGETEATFRHTLALAERIARYYPADLLRLFNQPHTLDPCSPLSREPEANGVHVGLRTFADYDAYCRRTAGLDPTLDEMARCGYTADGRPAEAFARMVAGWQAFCRAQACECG